MKTPLEILNKKLPAKTKKYVNWFKIIECMEEYAEQFMPEEVQKRNTLIRALQKWK